MTSLPDPKPITVGIDVSEATLDVAIGVKATPLSVSNTTDGRSLQHLRPRRNLERRAERDARVHLHAGETTPSEVAAHGRWAYSAHAAAIKAIAFSPDSYPGTSSRNINSLSANDSRERLAPKTSRIAAASSQICSIVSGGKLAGCWVSSMPRLSIATSESATLAHPLHESRGPGI